MENTLENKAKFFAQYYSVPCIENDEWIWRNDDTFSTLPYGSDLSKAYAKLKPISEMTDQDAVKIAEFLTKLNMNLNMGFKVTREDNQITVYYDALKNGFKHRTTIYDDFFARNYIGEPIQPLSGKCYDYLRSKGYALPYMGLSVEKLIEYGWVKLKTK